MINTTDILNDPLSIQRAILEDYEAKLNGEVTVVDANNSFGFLLEAFSRIVSDSAIAEDAKLRGLYPIRATTTKELFNHLSDYDYVGFFSYPASTKMTMMLHRDYLVRNAVAVPDTNYQLVIIPADTIFTIGRFKMGIYYPIHIRINSLIDTVSAQYDTSEDNPLKTLATSSIEVKANTFTGIDLISLEFEVFQFDKQVITESVNPDIGFIKKYQYSDRFYAIRVFDITTGKTEVSYTLSDSVYDPNKPTVNLKIYPESNEIVLSIPQTYFTTNRLGRKLQIEIYTTAGELDVSLANLQLTDITADFAMTSPNTDIKYTSILKNIPTVILTPSETRIVGGSNSYTFTEMKDYAIYHTNSNSVPITRLDLERFFKRNGFLYMAKIDNLTDRRYYAYKKLFSGDRELGVASGGLTIPFIEDEVNQGVLYQNNNTIVVLPTVIYRFLPAVSKFEVVSDETRGTIVNATGSQLVNILNNSSYFCNPHHVVITTLDRYPICEMYDMFTTEATNMTFLTENMYLSSQLSAVSAAIRHLGNGAGGYVIRTGIQRSEDLKGVASSDLNCSLTVMSKDGFRIGIQGAYIGTFGDVDVFDFTIATNYKISNTKIAVTNFSIVNQSASEFEIELSGTMYIATFVKKTLFPDVGADSTIPNYLAGTDGSWLGISLQSFEYTLGTPLNDVIDPNLLTNWTTIKYQTYELDIAMTYDHDVYEMNPDGTIAYTIDPDTSEVVTNKLHSIDDPVYSNGELVIQHRAGDVVTDSTGAPIEVTSRIKDFTFELSTFEYSNQHVTKDFLLSISNTMAAYYQTIRQMNTEVLENTDIFFRPIVTTNTGRYKVNNSTVISSSLELEFVFNCYVAETVSADSVIMAAITTRIQEIIVSHLSDTIISMTDIANDIRNTLSAYLNSIDVISLNGESAIQTLMNIDIDKSPKLGTRLALGVDGRVVYVPNIYINFRALDK